MITGVLFHEPSFHLSNAQALLQEDKFIVQETLVKQLSLQILL